MRMRTAPQFETMAATQCLSITEQWIRERLNLQHQCLADVRSLRLPGTYETGKIGHLGISLKNFVRLKSLDLSHNALVSVEGILHLKLLENLNLYYNRISSLQDVLSLGSLQNLKELDLRLNPVVKKDPFYRLHLVQAISKLRKLDDCVVRDRERKAALMHFSAESGLESCQKSPLSTMEIKNRSSNPRIASVNKMMMSKLMLREGNEETVLNHNFDRNRNISTQEAHIEQYSKPESTHLQENPSEILNLLNDYDSALLSSQKQEFQSKLRKCHNGGTRHTIRPRPSKDIPRVTFVEPSVKRCTSGNLTPIRTQAESYFTPYPSNKNASSQGDDQPVCLLKNYSERKMHPPRLTYRSSDDGELEGCSHAPERARNPCKGAYRKPMELLLSLVDEYWSGEMKDHNSKHFFMHAVRILCMMEQEVANGESEMTALREKIQTLSDQIGIRKREHQSELRRLSEQLKQAHGNIEHLDQELRCVLEENVSLQKQLIRLEQQLLSDKLREMPNTQR
ncbi:centrosomal protein of 72 kDa isoform X2 [Pangasianodon hypophthalmus]|uniref:centrosomal protein of 72 kDa isoform X2 n=1 Tax=Pangasianodon hypophthalmus TaxID=310915 RepID=UPI002308007C|nr:centrosomal protein of 72 kDa isoform X2 [Pangasianodon hypophthalmus]